MASPPLDGLTDLLPMVYQSVNPANVVTIDAANVRFEMVHNSTL